MPQAVYEAFSGVNWWSRNLRCEVGLGSVRRAWDHLEAAKQIMDWVENRL